MSGPPQAPQLTITYDESPIDDFLHVPLRAEAGGPSAGQPASWRSLTPWLLSRVADLTEGASVRANTALIVNDARVAGQIATQLPAHVP